MKRLLLIAALLVCADALATPNMPMVCKAAAVNSACPGDSWTTAPGADGKYVAAKGRGVIDWKDALPTDLLRVCPSDITAGTACPVARIDLAKSLAAGFVAPPEELFWNVKFIWDAPTKDVNGAALPAGEITGYVLSWNYAVGGDVINVNMGNALTYSTRIAAKRICARVTAVGKSGEGTTADNCKDPPTAASITPGAPTNFDITFSP